MITPKEELDDLTARFACYEITYPVFCKRLEKLINKISGKKVILSVPKPKNKK